MNKLRTYLALAQICMAVSWGLPAIAKDFSLPPQVTDSPDEGDDEPSAATATRFPFQLGDEEAPSAVPFENMQFIQDDQPPSELGAVPGQHIRPRRTDVLGSIGFPAMRPYKPDLGHKMRKLEAEFGEGLTVKSDDDYFSLTFHNLTQVDARAFNPSGDPLHDNFTIPRQRWYVLGNVSPYVRYYTVINRGYGSLDVLDAWTDWAISDIDRDKLQVRMGRMKTPYTYEYIKISENDLIAAERSVFVGNLAPNREIGVMAHGQVVNKQIEYAVGLFNGPRRSFEDFNNGKDLFTFLNTKPFLDGDIGFLKQLNIGGSWNWGNENQPLQPAFFTTANDQSPNGTASNNSPTFFAFGKNVYEHGTRMQWSGDVAYYYKSLGLLAGYQGGFQDYSVQTGTLPGTAAFPNAATTFTGVVGTNPTRVPMNGYSIAAFYFLTGEEVTRRRELLEPRDEYIATKFWQGNIGAVEAFGRFAYIDLGKNVFTAGLADPTVWSARANVIDTGFNWYLNHYTKLTFDWQYASYGSQVFLSPGKTTSFTNLFWFRTQVFF
ncbi:MAG TPA: porin [Planctomycetaceae bacterium]|jgi:phosphate-selective porin OprO/OprP